MTFLTFLIEDLSKDYFHLLRAKGCRRKPGGGGGGVGGVSCVWGGGAGGGGGGGGHKGYGRDCPWTTVAVVWCRYGRVCPGWMLSDEEALGFRREYMLRFRTKLYQKRGSIAENIKGNYTASQVTMPF